MPNGDLVVSGIAMCRPPARSIWRTSGPPALATRAVASASTMAWAISTVPRSTPPVIRDGRTCSTTGESDAGRCADGGTDDIVPPYHGWCFGEAWVSSHVSFDTGTSATEAVHPRFAV